MDAITFEPQTAADDAGDRRFVIDTTFVLFFLAVDTGLRFTFGVEGVLAAATLAVFLVLPYFLPFDGRKPQFERWILGRSLVACFAILAGMLLGRYTGGFLPDIFRFVPFSLLMLAGMISCCIQLNNLFRFRLAK